VAVVGVGQELNGDDAAGVLVARRLAKQQRARENDPRPASISLLVVEGAHAPENCTGALRRFAPDLVLLVDAAEMEDPPGTVRWLDWHEAVGLDASTHSLPASMVARYLVGELSCEVALIGIQVQDTSLGAGISPAVRRAIRSVSRGLTMLFLDAGDPKRPAGACPGV
jgi:hydrogenase 3 maturation protease